VAGPREIIDRPYPDAPGGSWFIDDGQLFQARTGNAVAEHVSWRNKGQLHAEAKIYSQNGNLREFGKQ